MSDRNPEADLPIGDAKGRVSWTPIMRLALPKIGLCQEELLYFRRIKGVDFSFDAAVLAFEQGDEVSFDTYFNSVSVGKLKDCCEIPDLCFRIRYSGELRLTFSLHREGYSRADLLQVALDGTGNATIPLPFWPELQDGMLYVRVRALSDAVIYETSYGTRSAPQRDVSLGIVVTTFNRQAQVLAAVRRLDRELLADPDYAGRVRLVVVDNGRNVVLPSDSHAELLPNPNLGGAGGFSRGLLHLMDQGQMTHCLFMDDDASCETEAIRRSVALLGYAKDEALAIAGAMLKDEIKFIQHERVGIYDTGRALPQGCGLDLRHVFPLLVNERPERADYAAWWFFAFPVAQVRNLAFPFFVRGDDIMFRLRTH